MFLLDAPGGFNTQNIHTMNYFSQMSVINHVEKKKVYDAIHGYIYFEPLV